MCIGVSPRKLQRIGVTQPCVFNSCSGMRTALATKAILLSRINSVVFVNLIRIC